jgi:hypothetical protein
MDYLAQLVAVDILEVVGDQLLGLACRTAGMLVNPARWRCRGPR